MMDCFILKIIIIKSYDIRLTTNFPNCLVPDCPVKCSHILLQSKCLSILIVFNFPPDASEPQQLLLMATQ